MKEQGYIMKNNKNVWENICKIIVCLAMPCYIIFLLGVVVCFALALICATDATNKPKYTYVSIIRQNNNTNIDNIKRTVCLEAYFKKFPFNKPNIGYELVLNSTTNLDPLYTLDKFSQDLNTTLNFQDSYNNNNINHDFKNNIVVVAWDHNHIPELAQSLGCRQCKGWNNNPKMDIIDDSHFDVTWVLRKIKYKDLILNRGTKIEFYTVSQNLENSILRLKTPITENMSTLEIVQNYECEFVSVYDIKKW